MSIVATEVESIDGSITELRTIYFRCKDHLDIWHTYGPVFVPPDVVYVPADHFIEIAAKVADQLANIEYYKLVK